MSPQQASLPSAVSATSLVGIRYHFDKVGACRWVLVHAPAFQAAGGSDGAGHVAARIHLLVGTLRVNVEEKAHWCRAPLVSMAQVFG